MTVSPTQRNRYHCVTPKGLQSQALSYLLAQFSSEECEPLYENLSCEEISLWKPKNGALPSTVYPFIEVMGHELSYMILMAPFFIFQARVPYFNNEVEYETLTIGLISALHMGI